jgi:exodeoxyribonuclease V gamma subunit
MSLHVHRSPKVEVLVDALHGVLSATWPRDPFAAVPVLVGSRGMGRWLRHELATRADSAARIDFLFPRNAFEAAAAWLLDPPEGDDLEEAVFWDVRGVKDAWSGPRLVARVLVALRSHVGAPSFDAVRTYLGRAKNDDGLRVVGRRDVAFAVEVAGVIERLHYDRPHDALLWSAAPAQAPPEHRWLAELLGALEAEGNDAGTEPHGADVVGPSPAVRLARLRSRKGPPIARAVHVFGLSSLRPGDKLRLAELAKHLELHFYALVPSRQWWSDLKSPKSTVKAIREKLAKASLSSLDHEEIGQLFSQNEQLAANGGPSRDLQLWLEETSYQEREQGTPEEAEAETLLHAVQTWIDAARPSPDTATQDVEAQPWTPFVGCPSLEIHACHGALRQCEALRDELLRRFAADDSLEPRHVLVTTPDVATYAPLVAAVFGRASAGIPAIPVHIADLGLRATNPVADALMRTLALTDERVTASLLIELLELEPVRLRFGLSDADVGDVRELVVASGLRWAWDAADRALHGQPAREQNTVHFGLERMALGVLMPDEDDLGFLAQTAGFDPIAPLDVATRDRVARFGKFAAFVSAIAAARDALRAPGTVLQWRDRLQRTLDAVARVDDEAAWLRAQVNDALLERLPDGIGAEVLLDKSGVVALLADAFEHPTKGDRPVTGAVTVCAMEPMRSVPFRVIAMLGLDDGKFPRTAKAAAWDPFATPRLGEHDRRTLDRHLFLETLLCARDGLLLFGTGFEPKRGGPVALSVVASELEELVRKGVGLSEDAGLRCGWPTRRHPLQPWSEAAFAVPAMASPRAMRTSSDRWPYDPVWFEARRALVEAREGKPRLAGLPATAGDARWPSETNVPTALTVAALAAALENAPKELLKRRLGLELERPDDAVPDREPIELADLDGWTVRARVLSALNASAADDAEGAARDGVNVSQLETRLRAEGTLPLDAGGAAALAAFERDARSVRQQARALGLAPRPPMVASVTVLGLSLSAGAEGVRVLTEAAEGTEELVLLWTTASKHPSEKAQLHAWLTLLVARAAEVPAVEAAVVGVEGTKTVRCTLASAEAHGLLACLVSLWRTMRERPVPLLPRVSRQLADLGSKHPERSTEELLAACTDAWEGGFDDRGARADSWVSAVYPEASLLDLPHEELRAVAELVWGPLVVRAPDGKVSKTKASNTKAKRP